MEYKIYEDNNIKEKLYHGVSEKGLNVYYMPKPGYKKQHAIITVDVGSNTFEFKENGKYKEVPKGIAHFLEHKMFEDEDGDLFDKYSQLGMDSNAYTGYEETSYLFTSTSEFYEGLSLLIPLVEKPYFTEETVENEKGIIVQEIKMYEDDPYSVCYNNLLESIYSVHPIKEDIAGSIETVNKTSYEDLKVFHESFYNNNSMVLFVIGDLDFDEIMETVNNVEVGSDKNLEIEKITYDEPKTIVSKEHADYMNIENTMCYIGFKDINVPTNSLDRVKKDFTMELVLGTILGNSSDFYGDLYDEGIIDLSFGSSYSIGDGYAHSVIFSQTDRPKDLYLKIIDEIKRNKNGGFNETDFERIKNKTIGQHVMGFNFIENIAGMFTTYYFDEVSIFDVMDILKDITFNDAKKVLEETLIEDLSSLSIIYPVNQKEVKDESDSI